MIDVGIHHDYLAGVHQDVNTTSSPTFANLALVGTTSTADIVFNPPLGGTLTLRYDGGTDILSCLGDFYVNDSFYIRQFTQDHVLYAKTNDEITHSANFTFDGTNLDVAGTGDFGDLTIGTASITDSGGSISFGSNNLTTTGDFVCDNIALFGESISSSQGLYGVYETTLNSLASTIDVTHYATAQKGGSIAGYCVNFQALRTPATGATGPGRTALLMYGGNGNAGLQEDDADTADHTLTTAAAYRGMTTCFGGVSGGGTSTITTGSCFFATAPNINANGTIATQYAFYDTGQDDAGVTTAWGIGINTDNSYINGSLRLGSAVAPTVPLDVTGQALISGNVTLGNDLTFDTSVDSASVADEVSLGGYDKSAGNRVLAISQESAVVAEADETKFSDKLPVRINGTDYFIMLTQT